MIYKEKAYGQGSFAAKIAVNGDDALTVKRHGLGILPILAAALAMSAVAGCAAIEDMTQSDEAAAAEKPSRVSSEGAKEEFPNLSEVPDEPKPHTAPEDRERVIQEMLEDRNNATYSTYGQSGALQAEPAPLVTAAGPDPFATSTIITADSVTVSDQVAGLSTPSAAAAGQLAAIIFFSHGSFDLDAKDRDVLQDIVTLHQQRGGSLRIVGHASSRTQNATPDEHQIANFDMSATRANAVMEELVLLGVAPEAMQIEAKADAEPVYHEFMPSGEAGNRRVEIFLEN